MIITETIVISDTMQITIIREGKTDPYYIAKVYRRNNKEIPYTDKNVTLEFSNFFIKKVQQVLIEYLQKEGITQKRSRKVQETCAKLSREAEWQK